MAASTSRDNGDDVIGTGYPSVMPRGTSNWIDSGNMARNNGYPFKRYPAIGRPMAASGDASTAFFDKDDADVLKGSGQLPTRSNRAVTTGRNTKADGESGNAKRRACICSILISVVVCCFLSDVLLQGSVVMLWKQTEFPLNIGYSRTPAKRESSEQYMTEYKLRFEPWKLRERVSQQKQMISSAKSSKQDNLRSPNIALVCPNLQFTPESLYLITLAKVLQSLGYEIQLFTFNGGPMQRLWKEQGIIVEQLQFDPNKLALVDWSRFEGVIVYSLHGKHVFRSFLQEPFQHVVVVWVIFEDTLGKRLRLYESSGSEFLIYEWKQAFARADVVIFTDYTLAMMHTLLDTGNFLVIPGYPKVIWDVKSYMNLHTRDELRQTLSLGSGDIVLTIVGSPFTYKGIWKEHAMVIKAVSAAINNMKRVNKKSHVSLKLLFLGNNPAESYTHVLQAISSHFGIEDGRVFYYNKDNADFSKLLWVADIVVYSSLRDEQEFPGLLLQAIAFDRFVLVPNLTIIHSVLTDSFGSLFYPIGDLNALTKNIMLSISRCKSIDRGLATRRLSYITKLLVQKVWKGYADVVENILPQPSDAKPPKSTSEISEIWTTDWMWELFPDISELKPENDSNDGSDTVIVLEQILNNTSNVSNSHHAEVQDYENLTEDDWNAEKTMSFLDELEHQEEEQIEERREILRGSWESVYKVVKKMERLKNELHERDDADLERIGQILCIYEPYTGIGASVFLHKNDPLYQGISLISKERRLGYDDIDAASRLPLLNDSYYQEVLCEFGAFFAIANQIDRVHKNSWIGFQSWRAFSQKVDLSTEAERALQDTIKVASHGDAFYFWAQMANDDNFGERKAIYGDFWSLCDMVNNNNCRFAFMSAFKRMYGLPQNWTSLPPMPVDGGKWSGLHCWAMSTSSFQEFVMFARMFVDALDSEYYIQHHDHGHCLLGASALEGKHCYCSLLELLVNVWAYHSARAIVYVDPKSGAMYEQHGRRISLWSKYFELDTLKGMDEDLAEEVDDERRNNKPKRRLWPDTGEVFWHGMYERERQERLVARMEKRKKNKERLERIRSRLKYKPLGSG